jgi:dTDP-4-amino-4,6-dideoxygalactose transaminase
MPDSPGFLPSLATLDPQLLLPTLEPPRPARFPLDQLGTPNAHLFYLARAGVFHAVRHFAAGGRVLMPAYHHGVEVEAAYATGATLEFYRVDANMMIDVEDILRRAKKKDAKVIYVTHFVGFAQPLDEILSLCRERNLKLIEDCALALFSRDRSGAPLGARGDAGVFCLYKSLPVPHGGLLVGRALPTPTVKAAPLGSTLHHMTGQLLSHLELRAPALGRPIRSAMRRFAHATVDQVVENVQTGTLHLLPYELELGASPLVSHICRRLDLEMVVVRRRRNFRRLAEQLEGIFEVIGAPLAPGVCPLFLPIRVRDKPRLLKALHARDIDAIDFWGRGESEFAEVSALRREILELPCHQSLDDEDIDRVARAVKEEALHAQ